MITTQVKKTLTMNQEMTRKSLRALLKMGGVEGKFRITGIEYDPTAESLRFHVSEEPEVLERGDVAIEDAIKPA